MADTIEIESTEVVGTDTNPRCRTMSDDGFIYIIDIETGEVIETICKTYPDITDKATCTYILGRMVHYEGQMAGINAAADLEIAEINKGRERLLREPGRKLEAMHTRYDQQILNHGLKNKVPNTEYCQTLHGRISFHRGGISHIVESIRSAYKWCVEHSCTEAVKDTVPDYYDLYRCLVPRDDVPADVKKALADFSKVFDYARSNPEAIRVTEKGRERELVTEAIQVSKLPKEVKGTAEKDCAVPGIRREIGKPTCTIGTSVPVKMEYEVDEDAFLEGPNA